jgi:hypothetical protein
MNTKIIDENSKFILKEVGILLDDSAQVDDYFIPREIFINDKKYNEIRDKILELKYVFSSSSLTCLHLNANVKQRFPLLNLVRQILSVYGYKMTPVRKSDGYTKDGVKKYKRFFQVSKKCCSSLQTS